MLNTMLDIFASGVNEKTHITAMFASIRPVLKPMLFSSSVFMYRLEWLKGLNLVDG